MPDESDAGDDPGDVDDASDAAADETEHVAQGGEAPADDADADATASDASDESNRTGDDAAAGTDVDAESGDDASDEADPGTDAERGGDDASDVVETGSADTEDADDAEVGTSEGDEYSVDDESGGLRKVEPEVDPEIRGDEGDGDEGAEASVPNRGVEAGFDDATGSGDHANSSPPAAPEDGPGPRPRRHPDRPDPAEAKPSDDVPVGHAAGAPNPGEASAAGAGAGGGGGGAGATAGQGTGTDDVWYDPDDTDDDDGLLEGPPDDEEMPLADHIEEMVLRLAAVITVGAVATAIMFLYADRLVVIMWNDILPAGVDAARPHLYGPLEFILTKIKVASLAGILLAVPVLVYQSYLFMRPGLYPKERKYYLAAVPTSLVLATFGMAFAYFLVLPGLFNYFLYYTQGNAQVAFGLAATFNLIVALMALLAVVFQIPLFIMLAIMMGITTRRWLEQRRILFWGAFAGIAFLFAPDPTGMAPFVIAVTMILLFEGTLLLLRWTGR